MQLDVARVGLLGSGLPARGREYFVHAQNFRHRRSEQGFAEGLHQTGGFLARTLAAVAHPLLAGELVAALSWMTRGQLQPA